MKASVIIPCYNLGTYLEEALTSALQSSHPDFEVIVIDDGSTEPETRVTVDELEKRYAGDSRVRFLRQANAGLSAARNRAIEQASGECILPLDADNRIRPEYLERATTVLADDPETGVVHGWAERFGAREGTWEFLPVEKERMLLGNGVEACAVFRKKVWDEVGGYEEQRFKEGYEDWDFWLGALERGWRFHVIPEVMFDYRVRPGSMVSACNEPAVRQKLVTQLIEKHRELYASCWPALLVRRDLSMLEYEKTTAGYHQRYVEAQAEYHRFARECIDRCERLEARVSAQQAQLHDLRHVRALLNRLFRSRLGRAAARLRRR